MLTSGEQACQSLWVEMTWSLVRHQEESGQAGTTVEAQLAGTRQRLLSTEGSEEVDRTVETGRFQWWLRWTA